jgi:hypothetical protein
MLLHGLAVAFINGSFRFCLPPRWQGELSDGTLEWPEVVRNQLEKTCPFAAMGSPFLVINQAPAPSATRDLLRSERSTTSFPRRIPACSIAW